MSQKYALIIGNTEYTDPGLAQLTAPGKDAEEFARVLKDRDICGFDQVNILLNQQSSTVIEAIDEFFYQKKSDDLLVLYFSGHGVRDELGALYLAVKNTNRFRLRSTAIRSDYISETMDQSRSRRQILILDCCNSGAFSPGTKAATGVSIGTARAFEGNGYGRVVLTASDATQFAWEGDQVIGETDKSLFTHFLVKGLEGEADENRDGKITVDDLYNYAYEQVIQRTPKQTPRKWSYKQQGEISLRQLTEAQKEQLRLLALQEQIRREQEEAEHLARIKADQEAAEQRAAQLIAAREAAEEASRAATEKIAEERAKLETAEQEYSQQRAKRAALEQSQRDSAGEATAKPQRFIKKNLRVVALGLAVVVIVMLGASSLLRSANLRQTTPTPSQGSITTSSSTNIPTEIPILDSVSGFPTFAPPEELSFIPVAAPLALEGTPVPLGSKEINLQNADEVLQLARWGKGSLKQVTYSSDGKTLLMATTVGVYLLDAETLDQLRFIDTGSNNLKGAAFSKDGDMVIVVTNKGDLLKFRSNDGSFVDGTKSRLRFVTALSFSADQSTIAIAGDTNNYSPLIFIQDIDSGKILNVLGGDLDVSYPVNNIKYSPASNILISNTRGGLYIWDTDNGSLLRTIPVEENYHPAIAFTPNGDKFAYVAPDQIIKVLDTQTGELFAEMEGHDVYPSALSFSPDGQMFYYTIGEGTIRVRSAAEDGALLQTIQGDTHWISSILFSPSGQRFVTVSDIGLSVWDASTGNKMKSIDGYHESVSGIAISNNDKYLVELSQNGYVRDIQTGTILQTLSAIFYVNSVAVFSPLEEALFTESGNNALGIWDLTENQLSLRKETNIYNWDLLAISPNGQILATAQEKEIELWKLEDVTSVEPSFPTSTFTLSGHTDEITSIRFSANNNLLASSSWDGTTKLWNVSDGTLKFTLSGHADWVRSSDFSPDGNMLATSSSDGTLILWRVDDGTLLQMIEVPVGEDPQQIAYSPNGQIIALATHDGNIYLWDARSGSLLNSLKSHSDTVTSLAFTSDNKLLVSGSDDGTVRLWGIP